MSRSRRQPYWTEGYGGRARKVMKRLANKRVRNKKAIQNGMAYKKEFCSWMIVDFSFLETDPGRLYKVRSK